MMLHGPRALSDSELIAILIGSGTKKISAVELARQILLSAENNLSALGKLSVQDLMKMKGIGEAKAISIVAAMEIGRRRKETGQIERPKIKSSSDAAGLFFPLLTDLAHEEFWVAFFNRSNTLMEKLQVSQGGISGTVTDVRMIMKKSLELLCSSLIICHNHPSGNLEPSGQDKEITTKIKEAARYFDIQLLDHIIIAGNKYFSFADEGIM